MRLPFDYILTNLFVIAILVGVKWYQVVDLIHVSLKANNTEHLPCLVL